SLGVVELERELVGRVHTARVVQVEQQAVQEGRGEPRRLDGRLDREPRPTLTLHLHRSVGAGVDYTRVRIREDVEGGTPNERNHDLDIRCQDGSRSRSTGLCEDPVALIRRYIGWHLLAFRGMGSEMSADEVERGAELVNDPMIHGV